MTMTREQRIARANEIFARVWGADRTAGDELDDAITEIRMTAEDVDDNIAKIGALIERLPDYDNDSDRDDAIGVLDSIHEYVEYLESNSKALWEVAARLECVEMEQAS